MVVPAQWQGSVEHFYHFFLGYFVPLVLWQEKSDDMAFTVRDCGPMNPWFSLLRPGTDLELMPPGVMLERYLSHRQERAVLHDWDNPTKFHARSLARARAFVLDRLEAQHQASSTVRITVLDRTPSPAFYLEASSEVPGSGANWRSIPNMRDVAARLHDLGTVDLIDPAAMEPEEQVRLFARTDILVAQHGAGLANMLWLRPGSSVIEIQPPLPPIIDDIFANLSAALGLDYALVRQEHEHAPVPPEEARAAVRALMAEPGAHVPTPPGRLPTRLLRRLPRRL